jgi:hypothetical protein
MNIMSFAGRFSTAGGFICKLYIHVKYNGYFHKGRNLEGLSTLHFIEYNITQLADPLDVLCQILGLHKTPGKKGSDTPLKQLQNLYSHKSPTTNMM